MVKTLLLLSLASLGALGCATAAERSSRDAFDLVRRERAETPEVELDGSYEAYVRYAMAHSPALRADFERWRAATLRVRPARALPEPVLTYGAFLRTPETRVGPQRQRVGIRQMFPWPSRLTHAANAASHAADAAGRRFEARAVMIRRQVAVAYWNAWYVHRARVVDREERQILASLEETLRARLEVGHAELSQLSQLQVRLSRLDDRIAGLDELERQLVARLLAVVGAPGADDAPIADDAPEIAPPSETLRALLAAAAERPQVRAMEDMAAAADERARAERAARLPSFSVGLDWVETGPARMPGVSDSGKDPVMVGLGLTLPIWAGAYRDRERSAHAEAEASRADAEAVALDAQGEVRASLAALRDSARRVRLYRHTLIPQASAAFESVLGAYQAGRAGVADLLLADRDLLELSLAEARASADHATAWAALEDAVGRPIEPRDRPTDPGPPPAAPATQSTATQATATQSTATQSTATQSTAAQSTGEATNPAAPDGATPSPDSTEAVESRP